jgi:hypothetical protein
MIPYKNTSIMKTAAELKIKRDEYLKDINEKRKQEAEEWLIFNSEKIEKQIIEKGICTGQMMLLNSNVLEVFHTSESYPYEFGTVSYATYNLIISNLMDLGFKITSDSGRPVFTLKISLPNGLV